MTTATLFAQAKPTGRIVDPCDWGSNPLPAYKIEGCVDGYDSRIQLPDGELVYLIDDNETANAGLYREVIAMDAGENVQRRWKASEQDIGGITAPTGPNGTGLSGARGQLVCLGDKQIGWVV